MNFMQTTVYLRFRLCLNNIAFKRKPNFDQKKKRKPNMSYTQRLVKILMTYITHKFRLKFLYWF